MPAHNPDFAAASTRPTLPEALSGLCLLAMSTPREDHGKLIEKFMAINPGIGIRPVITREALVELLLKWDCAPGPGWLETERQEAGELVDEFLAEWGGA